MTDQSGAALEPAIGDAPLVVDTTPPGVRPPLWPAVPRPVFVARVVVLCRTRGCPLRRFSVRGPGRIDLRRRVRRLRPGAQLQVRIVARGYSTKVRVFRATERRVTVVKRCIAPKTNRLRRGCG